MVSKKRAVKKRAVKKRSAKLATKTTGRRRSVERVDAGTSRLSRSAVARRRRIPTERRVEQRSNVTAGTTRRSFAGRRFSARGIKRARAAIVANLRWLSEHGVSVPSLAGFVETTTPFQE